MDEQIAAMQGRLALQRESLQRQFAEADADHVAAEQPGELAVQTSAAASKSL